MGRILYAYLYAASICLIVLSTTAQASSINTSSGFNMPPGVTEISREVYSLHMTILWICVAIAVVVFGVMFYSLIVYRKSKGAKPAHFHENTTVEIIWTAVPLVILVLMAVPATATLKKMYDTSDAELDVLVTGYQWRWRYEYLEEDVSFFSNLATPREQIYEAEEKGDFYLVEVDEPMVVPTGVKVRLLLTANDVIHSWWVPDLAVKKDAIPGFINETWFKVDEPGIYRGQCAELCGRDHAFMPIEVKAVSPDEYQLWLASRREAAEAEVAGADREWSLDELMERGAGTYNTYCAACHQPQGQGLPPMFPALAGVGMSVDPDGLRAHKEIVLYGKTGTAMPAFGSTLSAAELAAVITYERNAWGNDTGDLIQPSAIRAMLESQ
ncbi:Cytochrome c oxidase polypeptide II [Nitrincola lacisaponensis]|uniref:Cytochrome c oxidase subunit 2 n=1 Tax=Nitrincola lacisaponensis TaxID=267850 RepID=A0A063XXX8_9GAMM|nr:cytochrome c oxidase subunit II [Nitrincola lacisaponensis]KDE38978.1 Cytochrome c oxidase polypeptide II [Nitrincola lacisaponensis]